MYPDLDDLLQKGEYSTLLQKLEDEDIDPAWDRWYNANYFIHINKYEKGISLLENIESSNSEVGINARILENYAKYRLGRYDKVTDDLTNLVEIIQQSNNFDAEIIAKWQAKINDILGLILWRKGELHRARDILEEALANIKSTNHDHITAMIQNDLGIINLYLGNYPQAKNYFETSAQMFEQIGNEYHKGLPIGNIGKLYRVIGEITKALEYAGESLAIKKQSQNLHDLSAELRNVGILYHHLNIKDKEIPLQHFKKALKIRKEFNNPEEISEILYHMLNFHLDHDELEKAKDIYDEHSALITPSSSRVILQRDKIMNALLMKNDKSLRTRFSAKPLFEDIIEEPTIGYEFTIFCIFNLCDLLIQELKVEESNQIIQHLNSRLDQVVNLSQNQRLFGILVRTMLIKAQVSLVQYDIDRANKLIVQASLVVEERGINHLAPAIEEEMEKLKSLVTQWRDLVMENSTLISRIEETEIKNYLNTVSNLINIQA